MISEMALNECGDELEVCVSELVLCEGVKVSGLGVLLPLLDAVAGWLLRLPFNGGRGVVCEMRAWLGVVFGSALGIVAFLLVLGFALLFVLLVDCDSGTTSRLSSFMSMFQIRTVWSALQVAKSLMSGDRRSRVR